MEKRKAPTYYGGASANNGVCLRPRSGTAVPESFTQQEAVCSQSLEVSAARYFLPALALLGSSRDTCKIVPLTIADMIYRGFEEPSSDINPHF